MAVDQRWKDGMAAIDAATTRLGTKVATVSTSVDGVSIRVDELVQNLSNQPTEAEIVAFKEAMDAQTTLLDTASSGLDVVATTLNGIAADPVNPVPEEQPEPPV